MCDEHRGSPSREEATLEACCLWRHTEIVDVVVRRLTDCAISILMDRPLAKPLNDAKSPRHRITDELTFAYRGL